MFLLLVYTAAACVKFVENWKTVSGVLCERHMNRTIKGKVYNYDSGTTDTDVGDLRLRGRDMDIEEGMHMTGGRGKKLNNEGVNESGGNRKEITGKDVGVVWSCDEKRGTLYVGRGRW